MLILTILSALATIYISSYGYALLRNFFNARKSGLPYVFVPWDQNSFFWMVCSVPLQPVLQKYLPERLYSRLSLTIYGLENREGIAPYEKYATSQGNSQTYVLLTVGRYEVSTRDPEITLEILKRPRDFVCHELTKLFMNRFGANVLTADLDSWSRQRRIVASTVNEKVSKIVFEESLKQTDGLINEVVGEESSGETNGMFDMMKKIAINVLSGASMGTSLEWNDNANGEPKPGYKLTYIQAVKVVIDAVAGPIILPKWFLNNYPRFLPGQKFLKDLSHAIDEFPIHTKHLLDQERQHSASGAGSSNRNSIMSQLLAASEAATAESSDKPATAAAQGGLSEDEQIGNLFIFTAAGFDTTANTLAFSLVLLARYPEWQEWLHEEIQSILPPHSSSSTEEEVLDYSTTFPKATRVLACMLETLRLYPPLTHISRQTTAEQTIQTSSGTYRFPANSTVYVNIPALHLEPSVWRNLNLTKGALPQEDDENRFRPSRWIVPSDDGSSEGIFQPPRGMYIPWSGGPRICPGQKMAQVEYTAIFLRLFGRFRIEAVPRKMKEQGAAASSRRETREEVERRLEGKLKDAAPVLVLQMKGVFDVGEGGEEGEGQKEEEGVRLKLWRRE